MLAPEPLLPLYPGAWLLQGSVGGRPLSLPLLAEQDRVLLLDTGCREDIARLVLPALRQLRFDARQLRWIVITHCDVDHQGGNRALKTAAPGALLACGEADREQVESPEALMRLRYDFYRERHSLGYDDATRAAILADAGAPQPVDITFVGGESIRLGPDRELPVLHLPGHSRGHLGILDVAHRSLFGGDAIQGKDYRDLNGNAVLCPTYLYPTPYLETIRRIESLELQRYCGCHWPVAEGAAVGEFCAQSRLLVEKADQLIRRILAGAGAAGLTLRELCEHLGPQLGTWPAAVHVELRYAVHGHAEELVAAGLAHRIESSRPLRYACACGRLLSR
jgi:glyoxylase-like metal-dependent hydrolase (beta-lactamase superfamily II)